MVFTSQAQRYTVAEVVSYNIYAATVSLNLILFQISIFFYNIFLFNTLYSNKNFCQTHMFSIIELWNGCKHFFYHLTNFFEICNRGLRARSMYYMLCWLFRSTVQVQTQTSPLYFYHYHFKQIQILNLNHKMVKIGWTPFIYLLIVLCLKKPWTIILVTICFIAIIVKHTVLNALLQIDQAHLVHINIISASFLVI